MIKDNGVKSTENYKINCENKINIGTVLDNAKFATDLIRLQKRTSLITAKESQALNRILDMKHNRKVL